MGRGILRLASGRCRDDQLPPREIRQIFETNGLRMVHHELYWGGLGALPEPLYRAFLVPLQGQWRLGHGVARRQLAVAAVA